MIGRLNKGIIQAIFKVKLKGKSLHLSTNPTQYLTAF